MTLPDGLDPESSGFAEAIDAIAAAMDAVIAQLLAAASHDREVVIDGVYSKEHKWPAGKKLLALWDAPDARTYRLADSTLTAVFYRSAR